MSAHGTVHWSELNTHDVEKAKTFFGETLGWSFEAMPMPEGTYWLIKSGEALVGGMFEMKGEPFKGVPEHWLTYVAVDDVDARVDKARKAGAKLGRDPFDVPGVGRIAIVQLPGGAMMGWMTPAQG